MINKLSIFLALIMLAPGSVLLATPAQAQDSDDDEAPELMIVDGWTHDVPLKAIKDANGNIEEQEDFEIEAEDIITVSQNNDFVVVPSFGKVDKVKVSDARLITTELQFDNIVVKQNLASNSYLLDVIVSTENGNKYAFETVMVVLAPGQTLSEDNREAIIQSFSTVTVDISIVFRESPGDNNSPTPPEDLSVCYFHPDTDPHCKPVNGQCPPDAPNLNDSGNCHPSGCPDGYSMLDDDESGTCYSDKNVIVCPGSNAKVLRQADCAIYENPIIPFSNTTGAEENTGESNMTDSESSGDNNDSSNATTGDEAQNEFPVNEKGEVMDSFCGTDADTKAGIPNCTASEKEDSWTSEKPESSPGVPIDETTDSEETDSEETEPADDSQNVEVDEQPDESEDEESEEQGDTNSEGGSELS